MKLLRAQASRSAFLKVLASRRIDIADLIPGTGFALMCAFYATRRADKCSVEADGDMLLFQWGTHESASGEHFRLDVTRQFSWKQAAEDMVRQLSLTFEHPPDRALSSLGDGNAWCHSPDDLEDFVSFVTASRAYQALEQVEATRVALTYGAA